MLKFTQENKWIHEGFYCLVSLCVWCSAFLCRAFLFNLLYTDFSLDKVKEDIAQINPSATVFMVSGRTGEGIEPGSMVLGEVKKKKL